MDNYDNILKPKNQKNKSKNIEHLKNDLCPICGRYLVLGKSVDKHHFIPRLKGGKESTLLHVICHRKLHSVFTESEMANKYNNPEECKNHPEIKKFIKWVSKKDPEFLDSNKEHNIKKKKRK